MKHKAIFFIFSVLVLLGSAVTLYAWFPTSPELIEQPIAFSHKTHVNDNIIACEFCHVYADRGDVAGVPPVFLCASCHAVIKGRTPDQKQEIEKIFSWWDRRQPIPWKKIHDLPDFVYFSHKRHVKAGFGCFDCHGNVNMMSTPVLFEKYDQTPLSMGWCMDCHKDRHEVITTQTGTAPEGGLEVVTKTVSGPTDCYACHK